jgi:hypothetical protein
MLEEVGVAPCSDQTEEEAYPPASHRTPPHCSHRRRRHRRRRRRIHRGEGAVALNQVAVGSRTGRMMEQGRTMD